MLSIREKMPQHSSRPLAKKLGLRPGLRSYLVRVPADVLSELRPALAKGAVVRSVRGPLDFAMVFARSRSQLQRGLDRAVASLAPAGVLWASWPKKTSGVATDLDDHAVRELGLRTGLVDVKVCAVTEVWSGLKLVRRRAERGSPP